jgi:hypothetical protein
MNDSEKQSREKKERRPYERPTLMRVGLVAEQVLSVGCKLTGTYGSLNPASCMATPCNAEGS